MSSDEHKVSAIKKAKGAIRKLCIHGKAGPHSSKKGDAGYSRKVKHKKRGED